MRKPDTRDPDALVTTARFLEQLGRADEAIRLYHDAIEHAPCLEFYVNLGALQISAKRPDIAIASLQKAVELAPTCVPAHVNLAGAHSMLGNDADALASFRRALEIEPDNLETLTRLSAFMDRLGRVGAAAAKRAQKAALTTVVTTLPNTLAAPSWLVYEGRHFGLQTQTTRPHPNPLPVGEGTFGAHRNLLPRGEGEKVVAPADLASVERKIEKLATRPLSPSDSLRPPPGPVPGRAADEGREMGSLGAAFSCPILRSIGTSPNGGVMAEGTPSPPAPLPSLGTAKGEGRNRVAFVSPHCIMDFANGAATATRDALALLAAQGFACEAFCGTRTDAPQQSAIVESLARAACPPRSAMRGSGRFTGA